MLNSTVEFIEFDFDANDGRTLTIQGETDGDKVYFKAFDGNKKVSKSSLTSLDLHNIEEFILENYENEIESVSDFYERQNG